VAKKQQASTSGKANQQPAKDVLIVLIATLPPTLNQFRNNHFYTNNRLKKEWRDLLWYLLPNVPFTTPVFVSCTVTSPRLRDADNNIIAVKYLLDTMVEKGLLLDDNPNYVKGVLLFGKKGKALVEYKISDKIEKLVG